MKRITVLAFLLAVLIPVAHGQVVPQPGQPVAGTPLPANPPIQMFTITGNAVGYGGQHGTQAISTAGVAVHLTAYISVGYDRTWNPTDSKQPAYNLGDVNVAYELGDLLPGGLKKRLVFDTTNWIMTFQGSIGRVTGTTFSTNAGKVTEATFKRTTEGLGLYVSRPVNNNMAATFGYRLLFPGHVLVKMPTVGINFTF